MFSLIVLYRQRGHFFMVVVGAILCNNAHIHQVTYFSAITQPLQRSLSAVNTAVEWLPYWDVRIHPTLG